jgi:hypothetical protein
LDIRLAQRRQARALCAPPIWIPHRVRQSRTRSGRTVEPCRGHGGRHRRARVRALKACPEFAFHLRLSRFQISFAASTAGSAAHNGLQPAQSGCRLSGIKGTHP